MVTCPSSILVTLDGNEPVKERAYIPILVSQSVQADCEQSAGHP
jgi:hypothetical protein